MKLHKVKEKINRKGKYFPDVICDGKTYSADKKGFVSLPVTVDNKFVRPATAKESKSLNKDSGNKESSKDKSLFEMTEKELKAIAKKNKIDKFEKMNKDELIKAIEKK